MATPSFLDAAHVEQRAHDDARTAADQADNARLRAQVAHLTDRLAVAMRVDMRLRQQLDQATAARGQEPRLAHSEGERW